MLPDLIELRNAVAADSAIIYGQTKIRNLPQELKNAIKSVVPDVTFEPETARMTIGSKNPKQVTNAEILLACLSVRFMDGAFKYHDEFQKIIQALRIEKSTFEAALTDENPHGDMDRMVDYIDQHYVAEAAKIKTFIFESRSNNGIKSKGLNRKVDWYHPIVPSAAGLPTAQKPYISVLANKLRTVAGIYEMARNFVDGLTPSADFSGSVEDVFALFLKATVKAGLIFESEFVGRYIASLQSKRFVIFTGLSGSGKTQLSTAFAKWACPVDEDEPYYELVAVGANWTGREHIFGYADALDPSRYVTEKALELMLRAGKRPAFPHFLILDEMNLSHVERYFADVLSAMESGLPVSLHAGLKTGEDGAVEVPSMLDKLPDNLFIVGTVNVDETTYMFSPKVLDRAMTMEFRADFGSIEQLLSSPYKPDTDSVAGEGSGAGKLLVIKSGEVLQPDAAILAELKPELQKFFNELKKQGAEFAFRTAYEITRFVHCHRNTFGTAWTFNQGMDAAIVQKLLPRLHGSQDRLEPVLLALLRLCFDGDTSGDIEKREDPKYVLSADKLKRMLAAVRRNRFTSFAEN